MSALVRRYAKGTEDFHRKFTLPQEDRHKFTSAPWLGGSRPHFTDYFCCAK
jgi:hypothetical protein